MEWTYMIVGLSSPMTRSMMDTVGSPSRMRVSSRSSISSRRAKDGRCGLRLMAPLDGIAAPGATAERQDGHLVSGHPMRQEGAACADLDIVRVRPDSKHPLAHR